MPEKGLSAGRHPCLLALQRVVAIMHRVERPPDDFRLSKAPVVEALVELHFNKAADYLAYGPIPGQMFERLRTDYPTAKDLDAANFPLGIETPGPLVRHRFLSHDEKRLFQVGNGIVTANSVGYDTYAVFRSQASLVLGKAIELFGDPTRVVLRYINKIPTSGMPINKVLLVGLNAPSESKWIRQQASCAWSIDRVGEFQMTWANPVDGRDDLLLFDLQITSEPIRRGAVLDEVLVWLDSAHAEVEDAFLGNLDPVFLESLK